MKKTFLSPFIIALPLALTVAGASVARAQDGVAAAPPAATGAAFGQAGQWVYSIAGENEFPFRISKTGDGDWNMVVRPAIDTFLIRSVSVGAIVTLAKSGGFSDVGIGVRAGYNLPITNLVSFWPRAGVYYHHQSTDNGPSFGETSIGINAPFLFHLVPHAFLGVGPFFSLPVQNSDSMAGKDATYGLTAIIGGWL